MAVLAPHWSLIPTLQANMRTVGHPRMHRITSNWNAMLVVVGLVGLLGCQGVSTGKPSQIAQSQGTLTASPVTVGSTTVGTSSTQTGTLSATGASVSVSSVSLGGTNPSEFSVSGLSFPVTVKTGQPVSFIVTFTPGATGIAYATASFASNTSSSPSAANVTGTGTAAPFHSVSLSWTGSITAGVTSYNVYRAVYGPTSCGSYTNIGSTGSSTTAYTDSVVTDGTTYCYATTAVDASGESGYSNIAQTVIPPP
jgi:hypothetical protein